MPTHLSPTRLFLLGLLLASTTTTTTTTTALPLSPAPASALPPLTQLSAALTALTDSYAISNALSQTSHAHEVQHRQNAAESSLREFLEKHPPTPPTPPQTPSPPLLLLPPVVEELKAKTTGLATGLVESAKGPLNGVVETVNNAWTQATDTLSGWLDDLEGIPHGPQVDGAVTPPENSRANAAIQKAKAEYFALVDKHGADKAVKIWHSRHGLNMAEMVFLALKADKHVFKDKRIYHDYVRGYVTKEEAIKQQKAKEAAGKNEKAKQTKEAVEKNEPAKQANKAENFDGPQQAQVTATPVAAPAVQKAEANTNASLDKAKADYFALIEKHGAKKAKDIWLARPTENQAIKDKELYLDYVQGYIAKKEALKQEKAEEAAEKKEQAKQAKKAEKVALKDAKAQAKGASKQAKAEAATKASEAAVKASADAAAAREKSKAEYFDLIKEHGTKKAAEMWMNRPTDNQAIKNKGIYLDYVNDYISKKETAKKEKAEQDAARAENARIAKEAAKVEAEAAEKARVEEDKLEYGKLVEKYGPVQAKMRWMMRPSTSKDVRKAENELANIDKAMFDAAALKQKKKELAMERKKKADEEAEEARLQKLEDDKYLIWPPTPSFTPYRGKAPFLPTDPDTYQIPPEMQAQRPKDPNAKPKEVKKSKTVLEAEKEAKKEAKRKKKAGEIEEPTPTVPEKGSKAHWQATVAAKPPATETVRVIADPDTGTRRPKPSLIHEWEWSHPYMERTEHMGKLEYALDYLKIGLKQAMDPQRWSDLMAARGDYKVAGQVPRHKCEGPEPTGILAKLSRDWHDHPVPVDNPLRMVEYKLPKDYRGHMHVGPHYTSGFKCLGDDCILEMKFEPSKVGVSLHQAGDDYVIPPGHVVVPGNEPFKPKPGQTIVLKRPGDDAEILKLLGEAKTTVTKKEMERMKKGYKDAIKTEAKEQKKAAAKKVKEEKAAAKVKATEAKALEKAAARAKFFEAKTLEQAAKKSSKNDAKSTPVSPPRPKKTVSWANPLTWTKHEAKPAPKKVSARDLSSVTESAPNTQDLAAFDASSITIEDLWRPVIEAEIVDELIAEEKTVIVASVEKMRDTLSELSSMSANCPAAEVVVVKMVDFVERVMLESEASLIDLMGKNEMEMEELEKEEGGEIVKRQEDVCPTVYKRSEDAKEVDAWVVGPDWKPVFQSLKAEYIAAAQSCDVNRPPQGQ